MLANSDILFKEENEELFWRYWQKLTERESYRYFDLNIKTNIIISKNLSLFHQDKSFIYLSGKEPIAGVLLPIEKGNDGCSVSVGSGYAAAPVFAGCSPKKRAEIFSFVDKIALENDVKKIMFSIDPLSENHYNYLQEYDYLDTSVLVYIIDLGSEDLFNSCRRNHQRNINLILNDKDFAVFYIDKDNASYEIHEEYRELHHRCSGRITRPKETFDLQFEKLKQGQAVLFGLKYKNKNIAYVYFEFNSDKAVSFSAADDPDYDKFSLYHVLYFSAMEYLKKTGVRFIDTGQPSGPSPQFDYYPDSKQLNISLFKRGFGGQFKENFRGIKYFSQAVFEKDAAKFVDGYAKNL
ncbi:MAG: GNAT family N-acetyltransferase [Patescibacteria group bacterium]